VNVEEINSQFGESSRRVSEQAMQSLRTRKLDDPAQMIAVQFELQQATTMFGLHSAVIKLIKDTLMGIIAKIA